MKRFYLAVPVEFEEETLRKIVQLGIVQLTRDIPLESAEKSELVDICREFLRLYERLSSIVPRVKADGAAEEKTEQKTQVDFDLIKSFVENAGHRLNDATVAIERLEKEIKSLDAARERLEFLSANGLKIDDVGKFPHIFVKTGFMKSSMLPKLGPYVGGTSVVFVSSVGRPRENFVVITGLNEDEPLTEIVLKLLNFEEFTFPPGLNPEPKNAMREVKDTIELKQKAIEDLKTDLANLRMEFETYDLYVSTTLGIEEAKRLVVRTKRKCLIHGWIPSDKMAFLKSKIEEVVPAEKIYLKFENPKPEDNVPAEFKNKGILNSFAVFTNLQGTPNYFEVNPTPIYAFLYVAMFGVMFGDIGLGSVFVFLGFLLMRMREGLFSFSGRATRKLGQVLICCGLCGILFGFLYGNFFLTEIIRPLLLKPLNNMGEISMIALIFGVVQIMLAMILNTINSLRRHDSIRAIFSGRSIVGLSYYSAGIVLAIAFFNSMDFGIFLTRSVIIFTSVALASLIIIFLSPTIEAFTRHKEARLSEKLIEGFGEGLETLIVLIANSVSYIRLAAFAIAHDALALAAVIFAPTIGSIPSYVIMNVVVFLIEGFAALIQSLRLMYYEFSTKFYVDNGVPYKPLKITPLATRI